MKAHVQRRQAEEREALELLTRSPKKAERDMQEAGFVRDDAGHVCRVVRKFALVEGKGGVKETRLVDRLTRWNATTALRWALNTEPVAPVARRPGRRQAGPRSVNPMRVMVKRRRRPLWLALARWL